MLKFSLCLSAKIPFWGRFPSLWGSLDRNRCYINQVKLKRGSVLLCLVTVRTSEMRSEIHMLFRQLLNSYRLAPRPFPSCTEFYRGRRTGFRRQNLPEIIDVYVWIHTHTHTFDTFPLSPTGRFERRRRKRRGRRKRSCRTQSISVDAVFQPSSSQDQRDIPGFPE